MTINAELLSLKNDIAAALDGEPDPQRTLFYLRLNILELRKQLRLIYGHDTPDAALTADEMEDLYGPDSNALVGCDNR